VSARPDGVANMVFPPVVPPGLAPETTEKTKSQAGA